MHIRFVLNDFSLPLHGLRFRWYFRQLYDDLQEFVVNYRTPPLAAKLDASVSWFSVIGALLLVLALFIQYDSLQLLCGHHLCPRALLPVRWLLWVRFGTYDECI